MTIKEFIYPFLSGFLIGSGFTVVLLGLYMLIPAIVNAQEEAEGESVMTLASFETNYGDYGRYRGRAHNIRHATSMIAEVVLQPGEQFSFNERVGERTYANGFRRAPVIISGRMERGLGGGICQLASTIYAAAMYSGLQIVEHHAHSRTSSYIRPGLDATIDWGSKDLIIENPYPFPVIMQVVTGIGSREAQEFVSVTFLGDYQIYDVSVRISRRRVTGFDTIEEFDADLAPGQRRVEEPGTPCMRVVVWRRLMPVSPVITPIRERRAFLYPASNRIILVGPNP